MLTSYLPWLHILTVSYQIVCLLSTPVDGPLKNCLLEEKLIIHSACIISPQNKFHLDVFIMEEIMSLSAYQLSVKCVIVNHRICHSCQGDNESFMNIIQAEIKVGGGMLLNATSNNISVLLVEETEVLRENHQPAASH